MTGKPISSSTQRTFRKRPTKPKRTRKFRSVLDLLGWHSGSRKPKQDPPYCRIPPSRPQGPCKWILFQFAAGIIITSFTNRNVSTALALRFLPRCTFYAPTLQTKSVSLPRRTIVSSQQPSSNARRSETRGCVRVQNGCLNMHLRSHALALFSPKHPILLHKAHPPTY